MTNEITVIDAFTKNILHVLDMLAADDTGAINQSLIEATREQVEALAATSLHNEALMKSMQSAMNDLKAQRDAAIESAEWRAPKQRARIKRELAQRMALISNLPPADLERVLDLIDGSEDLAVSQEAADAFIEAVEALAIEAAESEGRRGTY